MLILRDEVRDDWAGAAKEAGVHSWRDPPVSHV